MNKQDQQRYEPEGYEGAFHTPATTNSEAETPIAAKPNSMTRKN